MPRSSVLALALLVSPAIAHECELPSAEYDHKPTVAYVVDPPVPWDHIATACGWNASMDTAPAVPALYAGGGAELFGLKRPYSCRYMDRTGLWHIKLPHGGGWRPEEVERCERYEFGSINGWKHSDPTE